MPLNLDKQIFLLCLYKKVYVAFSRNVVIFSGYNQVEFEYLESINSLIVVIPLNNFKNARVNFHMLIM